MDLESAFGVGLDFEKDVVPILHAHCQPCHFEGGTMYESLPFDDPVVVAHLGTDLFTRLKDDGERVVLLAFFDQMAHLEQIERSVETNHSVPEAHPGHGEQQGQHHQPHP